MTQTTLEQEALKRQGPIRGTNEEQIAHALRLEADRLRRHVESERIRWAVESTRAIAAIREAK